MRKILFTLMALIAAVLPSTMAAYDFKLDGVYYIINGNEVIVTYETSPEEEDYQGAYRGEVTIPATVIQDGITYAVTSIGDYAFYDCKNVLPLEIIRSMVAVA